MQEYANLLEDLSRQLSAKQAQQETQRQLNKSKKQKAKVLVEAGKLARAAAVNRNAAAAAAEITSSVASSALEDSASVGSSASKLRTPPNGKAKHILDVLEPLFSGFSQRRTENARLNRCFQ